MTILALTTDEFLRLYAHVPQWYGVVEGPPVPFGDGRAAQITVSAIFVPTRDQAERVLMGHAEYACDRNRMQFDADEWKVKQVALLGAS